MKVSGSGPISITVVVVGMLAAITALLLVSPGSNVQAESKYVVTQDTQYCNALDAADQFTPDDELDGDPNCTGNFNTGAAQTTTTTFCLNGPTPQSPCAVDSNNLNFSLLTTFFPGDMFIEDGANIPMGDKIGGLYNAATLGIANNPCNAFVPVPFTLFNVDLPNNTVDPRLSTNIYTPYPEGTSTDDPIDNDGDGVTDLTIDRGRLERGQIEGIGDLNGDLDDDMATSASEAIQGYPDWLLDVFDPDFVSVPPAQDGPRTEIIDGLVDVNGDLVIDIKDYGTLDGDRIKVGKVDANGDGTIDGTDNGTIDVPFLGTRNVAAGVIDIDQDTTFGNAADDYTDDHQSPNDGDIKPLIPLAVYGALTAPEPATTDWVPLYFAVFSPGQLKDAGWAAEHPFQSFDTALGYPAIAVLTDVTAVLPSIGAITDFCSSLLSQTMLMGVTGQCGNTGDDDATDDLINDAVTHVNDGCPAFGGAETAGAQCDNALDDDGDGVVNDGCAADGTAENGGTVRATSPASIGSYKLRLFTMSQRDLDADGRENTYDTCPGIPDTGDNDADGIDDACDPTPNTNTQGGPTACPGSGGIPQLQPSDHDGDCFVNRLDNAPLTANGRPQDNPAWDGQAQAENLFGGDQHGIPAADGGPRSDAIGDVADGQENSPLGNSCTDAVDNDGDGDTDAADNQCQTTNTQGGQPTTVTLNPGVANGQYHSRGLINAVCIGGTDADGDGWCASTGGEVDTGANAALLHPPLGDPPPDADGDLYDVWLETFIGTDDTKDCNVTATADDELLFPNWPPDFNDDKIVDISDINQLRPPAFFARPPAAAYDQRHDLNADTIIDISDINLLRPPVFFATCTWDGQQ